MKNDELSNKLRWMALLIFSNITICLAWFAFGSINPSFAEAFVTVFDPLAWLILKLDNGYDVMWHGAMSKVFYLRVTGQVIFVSFSVCVYTIVGIFQVALKNPFRFIEDYFFKNNLSAYSTSTILSISLISLISYLSFRAALPLWVNIIKNPNRKEILLHQLALWGIITPVAFLVNIIFLYFLLSFFVFVIRDIFRKAKKYFYK